LPDQWRPVVSCEHGGNRIPARYEAFYQGQEELLRSHRGWDPGALPLARAIAGALGAPLHASSVSRLLVELNRSPHHPALFSEISRRIPRPERERILARYYWPHWKGVLQAVTDGAAEGKQVLHLAVHTFTPMLDGTVRRMEMGILYDPGRDAERAFARRWREALRVLLPEGETGLRIRFNQPYRGTSDSLPTWLRKRFAPHTYLGVEMEVNQGLIMKGGRSWEALRSAILRTLAEAAPPPFAS